jgi:hypothetical protein
VTRRVRVAVSLAAAVLLTGCGGGGSPSSVATSVLPQRPLTWREVSASLTPRLDLRSSNPCESGAPRCIKLILTEMRRREAKLAVACDHRALFAQVYTEMTRALGAAAQQGRFRRPRAMRHFDAWFARYYFRSVDAWQRGESSAVPTAWEIAFDAADGRTVHGLGDVLLGMNAHISRDLVYTVADLVPKPRTTIDPDFVSVTQIIEQISNTVLEHAAARFDPTIGGAALPILLGGRRTFGQLIALWRTESWALGIALRDAGQAQRPEIEQRVETSAAARATAILGATAFVPVMEDSSRRDAYCAARR